MSKRVFSAAVFVVLFAVPTGISPALAAGPGKPPAPPSCSQCEDIADFAFNVCMLNPQNDATYCAGVETDVYNACVTTCRIP